MKKFLAIVISLVMVLSVSFGTATVAFAAETIGSQQSTKKTVKPSVTVNGNTTSDVEIDVDENDPNKIVFTYTGDGDVTGWNFYDAEGNLLVEGVDYTVVYDGASATVTVLADIEEIVADVIVDNGEEPSKPTTKPNNNNESPATGAMGFTGLAAAGVGVAILTALKKKADAE